MIGKELLEKVRWAEKYLKRKGVNQSTLRCSNTRFLEIELVKGTIERISQSFDQALSLTIYLNHKYSVHSTNILHKEQLKGFIDECIERTKYLTPDPYRSLPDPELYWNHRGDDLNIFDPNLNSIELKDKIDLVKAVDHEAHHKDNRVISANSSYTDVQSESLLIQSNGFSGQKQSTSLALSCEITAKDPQGKLAEAYDYCRSRHFNYLEKPQQIARMAIEKTLSKLGQSKFKSGKYDMILENRSASRLLQYLFQPLSAQALQQKQSCFEGKMNRKVATGQFTLIDNPHLSGRFGSRHFDSEGISSKKRSIFEEGILKNFYIDNYYGKKIGQAVTSGSSSNVILEPGEKSFDNLIKNTTEAILVTDFVGGNFNPLTAEFSLGINGFHIRSGEKTNPVNEMNITGNLLSLLSRLQSIGSDPYTQSSWYIPSLYFSDVDFSGI